MRRDCAAWLIALGALPATAQPQDAGREIPAPVAVPLEDFRLSGPPALGLLGIGASSVTRPNTPRDLIASLVSSAGSDGIVPDGYSLETAPYWLVRHRALGLREYYNASLADRLRYFTAVSVATSRRDARSDTVVRDAHVAFAVRTLLANGRPSPALSALGDSIRAQQIAYIERYRQWESAQSAASGLEPRRGRLARQEELLSALVTRVLVGQATALRDSAMRTLSRRDSLRALVAAGEAAAHDAARFDGDLNRIETELAVFAKRFASEEIEPDGFILEVAGGTRALFERGEWGRARVDGIGVWITPMYRLGAKGLELIGVARYLSNVSEYDGRNLLDIGARAGIDVGRGSLSAEHVWRSVRGSGALTPENNADDPERKRSTRWAVLFDYPLGGKLWAVASFGSDYRRPGGTRPVIATIGLNLGFGAIEILPSVRRP